MIISFATLRVCKNMTPNTPEGYPAAIRELQRIIDPTGNTALPVACLVAIHELHKISRPGHAKWLIRVDKRRLLAFCHAYASYERRHELKWFNKIRTLQGEDAERLKEAYEALDKSLFEDWVKHSHPKTETPTQREDSLSIFVEDSSHTFWGKLALWCLLHPFA
jgi:hypothetical protein